MPALPLVPESVELSDAVSAALHLAFNKLNRRARVIRDLEPATVAADRGELVKALEELILCAIDTLPLNRASRCWLHASTKSADGRVVVSVRVECGKDERALGPYDIPVHVGEVAANHGGLLRSIREHDRAFRLELDLPLAPDTTG